MACHDCGCEEGQIHKFGCDMEQCPFCGGQLISCGCMYKQLGIKSQTHTTEHEEQWLTILEEKGRVPYIVWPIICNRCGKLWPEMFRVSDEEWKKYIQISERGCLVCRSCFDKIKHLIELNRKVRKEDEALPRNNNQES